MSVQTHLSNTGSNLVLSTTEKDNIKTSINTLSTRLGYHFDNVEKHFIFGSFDRETILPRKVDENSDVDYMIVFKDGKDFTPQTLMNRLKVFVEKYYSTSEIHQSSPTIVLELNHIKFELAPAYEQYNMLYIPAPASSYSSWVYTNPQQLKDDLLEKNKNNNYEIKKLVRILKYWNVNNGKVYSSYELEKSIIDFSYWFCSNIKDYFYSAVSSLSTSGLPDYKKTKVENLKETVNKVKEYENDDMPATAESELKKVIPEL